MNIYVFELKAQARSFVTGTLGLACMLLVLMLAVFPVYHEAQPQVEAVLAGFPPQFAAAFGLTDAVFAFSGFFAFGFLYFSLIGAILGASWGISVFAREKRSNCTDFLLTKNPSRPRVFLSKLAVCLTGIVLSSAVFVATAAVVYLMSENMSGGASLGRVVAAAATLAVIQLIFMSAGALVAVFVRRVRSVSGMATTFGIVGFILAAVPELTGEEALRVISPFTYLDVSEILTAGTLDGGYAALAAAVVVACLGIAFVQYCRVDVRAA